MIAFTLVSLVAAQQTFALNATSQDILNDYINTPEPDFGWFDTGVSWKTKMGGTAYSLNVTSLKWLDDSVYTIKGDLGNGTWSHQVLVIVPYNLLHTNMSVFYGTGGCNENAGGVHGADDSDEFVLDALAHEARLITVVGYQMPNCHMIFKDDPIQKPRSEDHLLGYTLHYAYNTSNPLNFIIAPMVKANLACMKAATQFVQQKGWANLEKGFVSSGASKRGWTSWMVGAVTCQDCVPIIA